MKAVTVCMGRSFPTDSNEIGIFVEFIDVKDIVNFYEGLLLWGVKFHKFPLDPHGSTVLPCGYRAGM